MNEQKQYWWVSEKVESSTSDQTILSHQLKGQPYGKRQTWEKTNDANK